MYNRNNRLKFRITALLITILLLLTVTCTNNNSDNSFKFVFISDTHIQEELNADEGFLLAIEKINEINPAFVITGGDLVMDALKETYESSVNQFELYEKLTTQINAPVYNCIGNHDLFGVYEISGVSESHPEYGKQMYKNRIGEGKTYYSFDYNNWHFMILDVIGITNDNKYLGIVDSVQIKWIKDDLRTISKDTPITIVGHIPFITAAKQLLYGYPAEMTPTLVVTNGFDVLKLFEEYNLRLVLQGHLHILEEIIYKDTHFITGGAISGKWWEGANHGIEEGFLVVKMENDKFNWEFIDYGWKSTYIDTSTVEE
jgi:3',5'-cyclic AMP phosphodiesterase CpdA